MAQVGMHEDEWSTSPPASSMFAAPDPDEDHSTRDQDQTSQPIVTFGLITDIQHADNEDRWNFSKTQLRRYRNALKLVGEACQYWAKGKYPLAFILQLGDIIDGISFTNKTSSSDMNAVLEQFRRTFPSLPIYHIWGNHELYNFSRTELLNGPLRSFDTNTTAPGHYGVIEVCPHLRILALDTYEFSALGVEENSEVYVQSMELLRKYNQNETPNDPTGLRGHQRRFVQFNGGITSKQMHWLKEQLTNAKNQNDKVIVTGHIPIHPSACDHLDLLWNYKEVLDLLWTFDGTVLAYIAGHDHDGGYFRDRKNIHHITLQAVIECEPNTNSFATVYVYKESILIEGVGRIDKRFSLTMRLYNRVVLMHRKQIWQPWLAQGRTSLNYAMEHIPHVVWGIPFAAFFIVVIASKEIYKANAYQFNVYKRRLMVRRPEDIPLEYRPFCS